LTLTNTEHQPAHSGSRSTIDGMMASHAATKSLPGSVHSVVADEARGAQAAVDLRSGRQCVAEENDLVASARRCI